MNDMTRLQLRRFAIACMACVVAFFLVVLAGGVVRSTGAGMGCPDWPKCFGQYVPPTSVKELPPDYREIYAAKRKKKNERFARYLRLLGKEEVAERILNDPAVYIEQPFNAAKTWTEYVNRLVGALSGLVMLLTTIVAFRLRKLRKVWFWHCLGALVLLVFQAWIGSIVVSTNLLPGMITLHMLLAMALIAWMLWVWTDVRAFMQKPAERVVVPAASLWLLRGSYALLGLLLTWQIIEGTGVRETVDGVAQQMREAARAYWVDGLDAVLPLHRWLSVGVILVACVAAALTFALSSSAFLKKAAMGIGALLSWEAAVGMTLAWNAMPFYLQPLHLLVALVAWAWCFAAWAWLLKNPGGKALFS